MATIAHVQSLIHPGDTVFACVSRLGRMVGAARFMDRELLLDNREATPRRVLAACRHLRGYGGALVRERVTGSSPVGIHGAADGVSIASLVR